jgi:peptidoglycan/LPS O-acetylase OafA/YrhL
LDYIETSSVLIEKPSGELLQGQKISGTFTAQANNLGLVAVRFFNFNRINSDVVTFRLKNSDGSTYYENSYSTNQFLPNNLFTFGFPVISDSVNKEYSFEVESQKGIAGDAITLSTTEPAVMLRHTYDKQVIKNDPKIALEFLLKKIANEQTFKFDISFSKHVTKVLLILAGYFLLATFYSKKVTTVIAKSLTKKNILKLQKKIITHNRKRTLKKVTQIIDEFFLLNKNRNFPQLDGLRAWAVIMVVMSHMAAPLGELLNSATASERAKFFYTLVNNFPLVGISGGSAGVDLFFMLSAFLIYMTIIHKKPTVLGFLHQRLSRLLPAHLAVLVPFMGGFSLLALIVNIFFLAEFFPRLPNGNVLTWTMSYELLFYVVAAWWFIVKRENRFIQSWKFFFIFSLCIYLTQFVLPQMFAVFDSKYIDVSRFMAFLFGIALGKLYFSQPKLWKKLEKYFYTATIPGIILISIHRYSWLSLVFYKTWGQAGVLLCYLILDIGIFLLIGSMLVTKDHFFKRLFALRLLRVIGVVSYSLYLNHLFWAFPIAKGLSSHLPTGMTRMTTFISAAFLISFVIAVFLFHYLEKPYFLRKRIITNKSAKA